MTIFDLQQKVACLVCGQAIEPGAAWRRNTYGVAVGYMHAACRPSNSAQPEADPEQGEGEGKGKPQQADKGKGKGKGEGEGQGKGDKGEGKGKGNGQGQGQGNGGEQGQPIPKEWNPTGTGAPDAKIHGSVVAVHFDSLDDLAHYGEQPCKMAENEAHRQKHSRKNGQQGSAWLGVDTRDEVYRLSEHGWPAGVERMRKAFGELTDLLKPESIRRKFQWSDNGDEFDIHRAWSGHFDTAWRRMPKRPHTAPLVIRLVVDVSDNAGTGADAMFWRGAVCLWLTDALQEAGYHVEVIASNAGSEAGYSTDGGKMLGNLLTTTVKHARSPLEINTLATLTALAGTFRCFGFLAIVKSMDDAGAQVSGGLGHTTSYSEARKAMGQEMARGEYLINKVSSAESGKKEIIRLIGLIQGETTKEGKAA